MTKKQTVEEAAKERALKGFQPQGGKGGLAFVGNPHQDLIMLVDGAGKLTHAGVAYYRTILTRGPLDGPGVTQSEAAEMLHGKQKDLVDPYAPKVPEVRDNDLHYDRKLERYYKALDKRIQEREQPKEKGSSLRPFITGQTDEDLVSDARLRMVES